MNYICILRGINVGGKRKILMNDLKVLFHQLGFTNCRTYIQSGNILFNANQKEEIAAIENRIQAKILDNYGFDVPVIVFNEDYLFKLIKNNPFPTEEEQKKLHVTFLKKAASNELIEPLQLMDSSPDRLIINDKHIYLLCKDRYSDSKFTNTFF
jgi:uncharacterized protein (DUF1697 family)